NSHAEHTRHYRTRITCLFHFSSCIRGSDDFCFSFGFILSIDPGSSASNGLDVSTSSSAARTPRNGHAGYDHSRLLEHDERHSVVCDADAHDGPFFRREKTRNHRALADGSIDRSSGRAGQVFCRRCLFPHPAADDLDTHGIPLPVQQSGLGTELHCLSGSAAVRPGADRIWAFYFDPDGESNHRRGLELWNDHGAMAGGCTGEYCRLDRRQGGSYVSFDTQSLRRFHEVRLVDVAHHLLYVAH